PGVAGPVLYGGIGGPALAHWAMVVANRSPPAVTTSLGLLATPVVGVATSAIFLGEAIGTSLIIAMTMILAGIAIGTIPRGTVRAISLPAAATTGSNRHCRRFSVRRWCRGRITG